jgi:citrate synthase
MPTLAAWAHRHSVGRPYVYPDNELSYCGNFLNMLFRCRSRATSRTRCSSAPSTCCSSSTPTTSRTAPPTPPAPSARPRRPVLHPVAAAAAALYGPLHGGANEAVLRMLREIGDVENVPEFITEREGRQGPA